MSFSTRTWLVLIALAVVLFGALPALVAFYVDWLWFGEVGYRAVFWRIFGTRWGLGLAFGAITFALVTAGGLLARRLAPVPHLPVYGDAAAQVSYLINRYVSRYYALFIVLVAGFVALLAGKGMAAYWHNWLLYTHPVAFGQTDPVFHRDLSLYVFRLPMLQTIWQWLYLVLIVTFLLSAGIHVLGGGLRFRGGVPSFAPWVKAQLSVLLALIFFTKAWGYRLDAWNLLYSTRGWPDYFGPGFTDLHWVLPALRVLVVVAGAAGVATLVNIFLRGLWIPALGLALLILTSAIGLWILPAAVQQWGVNPNQLALEPPYIANSVKFTNQAFDMHDIETRDFPDIQPLTSQVISDNPQTTGNIRMWDYRPLAQSYKQLQELRPYYTFPDVDVDRYMLDGTYRQLMLSARELDIDAVPQRTWQNQHLVYTHGYGLVASTVNEVTEQGAPSFVVQNIPPESPYAELRITRPQIYFGELNLQYSLVGTTAKELDYPATDHNETTRYAGRGGVSLRNPLVRTAFSMYFKSLNILITDALTPRSRILFRRHISERLATLAPFLLLDGDPYIVISGGRLVWVQDAYTVTDAYPYAQPAPDPERRYNYMRNSVKVVTDAYDGTMRLYVADPQDPLVRSYQRIFPGLFRPLAAMPAGLRPHLRYPERLFTTQARLYTKYHMLDSVTFYQGEDEWSLAKELAGKGQIGADTGMNASEPMEPYYVIMRLPGEEKATFILLIPYTPVGKPNMIAWLAAKSDAPEYGKMLVYKFPKSELVYGPIQIEARIDQDPVISSAMTLWRGRGSEVIRGNLLVIPIGSSVLYAEPIFLKAQESDIPELKRVVLASGTRVVMEPTLHEALVSLVGAPVDTAALAAPVGKGAVTPGGPRLPGGSRGSVSSGTAGGLSADLVRQAREQYNRAQQALRKGDWAGYGRAIDELGKTLERLGK